MNLPQDIINDLLPLYAANECSAATRTLVEDYLRQNPQAAAELQRIRRTPNPGPMPRTPRLDEMNSLRQTRRALRSRAWLLGLAIFFSLAPFSVMHVAGHTHWMLLESPGSALAYGCVGIVFWSAYIITRNRSKTL